MRFPKPKKRKTSKGKNRRKKLQEINRKILERDDNSCKLCETFGVYGTPCADIHHIVFRSAGGGDEETNLIGLCRIHHDQAHGKNTGEEGRRLYAGTEKEIREKLKKIVGRMYEP